MTEVTCALIGDESLTVACGAHLLDAGVQIRAVATRDVAVRAWAAGAGLPVTDRIKDLPALAGQVDWLLSIANLQIVSQALLDWPARGAINFHDGPLPGYAGVNTPVWALLNGEASHGVTWHHMTAGVDEGDIALARQFDIPEGATAHELNARCYAEGLDSFAELARLLIGGAAPSVPQPDGARRVYSRTDLPPHAGLLDFAQPAEVLLRQVRALDFAGYPSSLPTARIMLDGVPVQVRAAALSDGDAGAGTAEAGMVLEVGEDWLCVAVADGALRLSGLRGMDGRPASLTGLSVGDILRLPVTGPLMRRLAGLARHEDHWRRALGDLEPLDLTLARRGGSAANWQAYPLERPENLTRADAIQRFAQFAALSAGRTGDLAFRSARLSPLVADAPGHIAQWVPLRSDDVARGLATAEARQGFAADLGLRLAGAPGLIVPSIGISEDGGAIDGTALTILWPEGVLMANMARLDARSATLLAARCGEMLRSEDAGLPQTDRDALAGWQGAALHLGEVQTMHGAFEAQVARSPDAPALVFEDRSLSYSELNARADASAAALQAAGVDRGSHVALCLRRGPDMVIGALAILKAGAIYVPLDPDYPAARLAHAITDSAAALLLTEAALEDDLAPVLAETRVRKLDIEDMRALATPRPGGAGPKDAAYLIYTSGSTGTPKGVSVSHRNVANFRAGMDAHIGADAGKEGGIWLAVTSLAFDISVLELFYTLARGFKVVLSGGETRAAVAGTSRVRRKGDMTFGLYYWGNDGASAETHGKYHLLLEGAKFADAHGFTSLWTPERHFHGFGGAYPNPSVTGAAVAAVTDNLAIRAGSCVAPLHHPARIAEEWAVIDNLTGGRAGIAFASGWQPDDFVLRPENTPPANKPALYDTLAQVRALWRGEEVAFPTADSGSHGVVTYPRPLQAELPVWVTTAGNPETWREAGALGANVLTHLLGQTIEEVREKIGIYHAALREAGHDPADFTVTMMLHTYLAGTREAARETARGPMKEYLRSAAGLIKQYAWAFPAFKKPAGVANPMQIDLAGLAEDEMEAILDFAFERYFEDAGLFGTVDDAASRGSQLAEIGVTEIACLIDYGINAATVLDGLHPLAELVERLDAPAPLDQGDFSVAAQIVRHSVTHLQCTPSMARLLAMNEDARHALGHLRHLYLGGEALPSDLLRDLRQATDARILNMYGPTETTIWSTVQPLDALSGEATSGTLPIGAPIANTFCHVLDDAGAPLPVGVPGTLWIGGEGVAMGYWQRPELTAERFCQMPGLAGGTLYNTGDIVAWRADGTLDYIGRGDGQIKIRGQRIELGEIEACLAGADGVSGAAVLASGAGARLTLTGYVTGAATLDVADLRAHVARHLPAAMVPAQLIQLETFPLTPNKKIDRAALPDAARRTVPAVAPVTRPTAAKSVATAAPRDLMDRLAAIWAEVLGLEAVQPQDNFFALGGHSLLAVQVHRDIRAALPNVALTITDVFRFPVLTDLAAHLACTEPGETSEETSSATTDTARSDLRQRRRAMRSARQTADQPGGAA